MVIEFDWILNPKISWLWIIGALKTLILGWYLWWKSLSLTPIHLVTHVVCWLLFDGNVCAVQMTCVRSLGGKQSMLMMFWKQLKKLSFLNLFNLLKPLLMVPNFHMFDCICFLNALDICVCVCILFLQLKIFYFFNKWNFIGSRKREERNQ